MEPNTVANVEVAATGNVYLAATGTPLPANWHSTLNAGFVNVGYIGEDGVDETINTDTTDIVAWGGDLVRVVQTKHSLEYGFTMYETTDTNLASFYGSTSVIKGDALPHQVMVIDWQDGDKWRRNVYPDVQITSRESRKLASSEVAAFGVTITCFPDTSGNKAYMYRDEDSVS